MNIVRKILVTILLMSSFLSHHQATAVETNYSSYAIGGAVGITATLAIAATTKYFIQQHEDEKVPKVACITFDGPVMHTAPIINKLINIQNDDRFDAILLILNCPGGRPGQSEIIHHLINTIAQTKPIVVSVIDNCCSGGYLLACGATKIVAPAISSVGCIGVLNSAIKEFPERYDENGNQGTIEVYPFSAGKFKSIHHPNMPLTEEEKEHIQESINKMYDSFCKMVARARKIDFNAREKWAEGIVFTGTEALELRLIDYVGGLNKAVEVVKAELRNRGKEFEKIQLLSI